MCFVFLWHDRRLRVVVVFVPCAKVLRFSPGPCRTKDVILMTSNALVFRISIVKMLKKYHIATKASMVDF